MDCPKEDSQEWKALKSELGSDEAVRAYIKNGGVIPNDIIEYTTGEFESEMPSQGNDVSSTALETEAYYQNEFLTKDNTGTENKIYDINSSDAVNLLNEFMHENNIFKYELDGFKEVSVVNEDADIYRAVDKLFDIVKTTDVYETTLKGEKGTEYRKSIPEAEIEFAKKWSEDATKDDVQKLLDYAQAIKMNELGKVASLKIDPNEKKAFDTMIKGAIRLQKIQEQKNVLLHNGKVYDNNKVAQETVDSMEEQYEKRMNVFNKLDNTMIGKYVPLSKGLKWLEKQASHITNARLLGKFLTGSDKSNFTNVIWKQMYKASGKMYALQNSFKSLVRVPTQEQLKKMSLYNNPTAKLDEMDTHEVELFTGDYKNGQLNNAQKSKVKLTPAELLTLYMNLREQKGDDTDPRNALIEDNVGIYLRDNVNGRMDRKRMFLGSTMPTRIAKAEEIRKAVESNPAYMELVGKIDQAIDERYSAMNDTYRQLMGWDLEKINNFFPSRYGKKAEHVKMSHMSVEKLGTIIDRGGNKSQPIQVGDVFEVLDSYNLSTSHYASFAIPVKNADTLYKEVKNRSEEAGLEDMDVLLNKVQTFINHNEDPGKLFKAEGEKAFDKAFNKFNNTFAVAVLGWNIPVMFKQTASYQLARESINAKYLQEAGWGAGGLVGIKPGFIIQSLIAGKRIDGSLIPLSWRADETNPSYSEMMKHSDILSARFGGFISREMGEYAMGGKFGNDKLRMRIGNKNVEIDRQRFMEGIKIFDSATIIAIWDAVKLETEAETDLAKESPEYWTRVVERTEEIVAKTQPTFDNANRMELALYRDPVARMFTMFTSATSKIGQLNMEAMIDVMNEPTAENKKKLRKRMFNTTFGVGTWIAATNMMFGASFALLGDDEDKAQKKLSADNYMMEIAKSGFAQFPIAREVFTGIASRVDNEFWKDNMEVPMLEYYNKAMDTFGSGWKWIVEGKEKGAQTYNGALDLFTINQGLPVFATKFLKADTKK